MSTRAPSAATRPRGRRLAAGLLVLAAGLAVTLTGGCSLTKARLEGRLLALEKNRPARDAGFLTRTMELDGETLDLRYLHVAAPEPSDRAPVVLVHGTPSTATSWVEILHGGDGFAGLPDVGGRDAYAIEVVGHGIGPLAGDGFGFQDCADFVSAAVRALDVGPVHLVGSSYGGEFAWRAALDAPELYASLTLLDSSGYERREGDFLPEEVDMRELWLAKIGWLLNDPSRIETALAPHFPESTGVPPGRVEEFFLVCENANNWGAMVDLVRDENGEREGELPSLAVPTLLVWGEDDLAYPVDVYAERFHEDIPGSRLVTLPTGHYPHEQRPADVVRELARFYEELES